MRPVDRPRADQRHAAIGRDGIGVDRAFAHPGGVEIGRPADFHHALCRQRAGQAARQLHRGGQRSVARDGIGLHPGLVRPADDQMRCPVDRHPLDVRFRRQGQPGRDLLLVDQRHRPVDAQRQHPAPGPGRGVKQGLAIPHHKFEIGNARHHVQRRCRERLHHLKADHFRPHSHPSTQGEGCQGGGVG